MEEVFVRLEIVFIGRIAHPRALWALPRDQDLFDSSTISAYHQVVTVLHDASDFNITTSKVFLQALCSQSCPQQRQGMPGRSRSHSVVDGLLTGQCDDATHP